MTTLPAFTILMATRNGAAHLRAQLDSLAGQTHDNWRLWVSDDGSTDGTRAILTEFAQHHDLRLLDGPQAGAAANFMSLLCHPDLPQGLTALCDQDDVWHPDKLARAAHALMQTGEPALYGAASLHVALDLTPIGASNPAPHGPSFENALVQNIVSGHTAALNAQGLALVRRAGIAPGIAFHDWWLYQVMTGCGGRVLIDAAQVVKYRQHGGNVLGSFRGFRGRMARLGMMLDGTFGTWMSAQTAALEAIEDLTPQARQTLDTLTRSKGPRRALALHKLGIKRQGTIDTIALKLTAALGRL